MYRKRQRRSSGDHLIQISHLLEMLLSGDVGGRVVVVEELPGFVERQTQCFPNLAARQFTFGEALEDEGFQQLTRVRGIIQMELPGELVWNLDSDEHFRKSVELDSRVAEVRRGFKGTHLGVVS